jgi:hypothetical protein
MRQPPEGVTFCGMRLQVVRPKTPHFDVILSSLLDLPCVPQYEYDPEWASI